MKFNKSIYLSGILTIVVISLVLLSSFSPKDSTENNNSTYPEIQEKYSEVRIFAKTEADFKKMMEADLFIDHANRKAGFYLDAWLSEYEMGLLKKSGVPYEILIEDWQEYYDNRQKMSEPEINEQMEQAKEKDNVTHSIYGSMGGFLTYNEVVSKLDSMRLEYPQFISQKFSIGNTFENRNMWAVRVTKNPDAPTGRPEVFYNALIHAREPESMETQMYYFYWLFENYGIDPVATYILDNREIYWMPVFNADGYVYNQTTNPNGGGMWRCNRKGNGSCGWVDLNRNFGIREYWDSPNGGSEEDSCAGGSSTYRGTSPFSEIETQNYMNFVNSRNFTTVFNSHTWGNYLLKPWDHIDPVPTPDDDKYNLYLDDMSESNGYVTGSTSQALGYMVRGGANDWIYNDSAHEGHNIIGFTPETGTGFWPEIDEIIPFAQDMLYPNQYVALIAGAFVNPYSQNFNQLTYAKGESGNLKVVVKNKGLLSATSVTVSLTPVSAGLSVPVQQFNLGSLASFISDSVSFEFTVAGTVSNNTALAADLKIVMDTTVIYNEKVYVLAGSGDIVLNDNGENTFTNWTSNQGWNLVTTQSNSPTHSFTDSPGGEYSNDANNSMTMVNPVSLSTSSFVFLNFYHKYFTEENYDYGIVEVSKNNENIWHLVKSYSGENSAWTLQNLDLTPFTEGATEIKVRFRLSSDGFLTEDGWYVDDVKLIVYSVGLVGIASNQQIPGSFRLEQNYPNPFNPSTVISYNLPKNSNVSLKVFDILGNEVATLVNGNQITGNHNVDFNGANIASGIYFYKLTADDYVDVKRMMLVK
jgi:carboxypeptidase T